MGLYRSRVLPWLIDKGTSHSDIEELRAAVVGAARGRVLEIGFGAGASLPHYRDVEVVVGLDPAPAMTRRAARRIHEAGVPVQVVHADAARIPFPDASFDTVVSVLSLCAVEPLHDALSEVMRVLRPGGSFLFLEHGADHDLALAQWQRRLTPLYRALFGCRLDLRVDVALARAGFDVTSLGHPHVGGPAVTSQMYQGAARPLPADEPRPAAREEVVRSATLAEEGLGVVPVPAS